MPATAPLHCLVITPERQVLDAGATAVVLPAHDGLVGILHDRAPLVCELGIGPLRVDTTDGGSKRFYVDGGFAQVLNNEVTILTDRAMPVESIDKAAAQKALADAEAMKTDNEAAAESKRRAVTRAKTLLALASK